MDEYCGLIPKPLLIVLFISRFIGLAPLTFARQGNFWLITLSRKYIKFGYLIMFITGMLNFSIKAPKNPDKIKFTVTRNSSWVIEILMEFSVPLLLVYSASRHMQCLISCLNLMQKISNQLSIDFQIKQEKDSKIIFCLIAWEMMCLIARTIDYSLTITRGPYQDFSVWQKIRNFFNFSFWLSEFKVIQFMLIALLIRSSFKKVNECLEILLKGKKLVINKVGLLADYGEARNNDDKYVQPKLVCVVSSAYVSNCDVFRMADRSYGQWLMMTICCLFLHFVYTPYHFFTFLTNEIEREDPITIVHHELKEIAWYISHLVHLVMIIEPCHLTTVEVEHTLEMVNRLMRRLPSIYDPLATELEHFLRQLALNDICYKPMKMIQLTRNFLLTIFGSLTTYIVLMLENH